METWGPFSGKQLSKREIVMKVLVFNAVLVILGFLGIVLDSTFIVTICGSILLILDGMNFVAGHFSPGGLMIAVLIIGSCIVIFGFFPGIFYGGILSAALELITLFFLMKNRGFDG